MTCGRSAISRKSPYIRSGTKPIREPVPVGESVTRKRHAGASCACDAVFSYKSRSGSMVRRSGEASVVVPLRLQLARRGLQRGLRESRQFDQALCIELFDRKLLLEPKNLRTHSHVPVFR